MLTKTNVMKPEMEKQSFPNSRDKKFVDVKIGDTSLFNVVKFDIKSKVSEITLES